ncbi:MAG: leucine-rich repeat domain-containing protein [Drouetiella hepatica Uher 2000/2452]|jgi:internalin A|uniref:non-specific serine/threonine protein kinase n=1 Tax=Drouetiella hepatica Uher 2000/2452 TaxID=904376 RepID=A0A951QAA1_9CYAN|nr:leucine-rich repeat domain-containing protein [Drouetiella hepatica Uher 2000/2452]
MPSNSRTFLASPDGVNRLNAAKARLNLTTAAIARQAGVSADTVGRLWHPERGKRVGAANIAAIAAVLGLCPEEIVLEEELQDAALAEAKRRIQEAISTEATELDLSGLQLTTVPESLGNLVNLTTLYLYENQLATVPEFLGNLVNLRMLFLYNNQLTTVPESLGNLVNLTMLSLSNNQLTTVPESLGNLVNLIELYLFNNQLTTVPESLSNLVNLTELFLSKNQLTTVPESLGNLVNLTVLFLSNNQLTTVPESLGNLKNLRALNLYNNQLTTVPQSLGNLVNLTVLFLYNNQLTTVPQSLGNLVNLTALYLDNNQLTTVPESLGNLKNLAELLLSNNQLTTVPEFIGRLTNLQRIDLNSNQLIALPKFLGELPNLQALLLHGNDQLGISNEILGATYEEAEEGATLANPQDILNYYFRTKADRQPLNEAKLILVGFGNVGKTSLVDRLIRNEFNLDSKKTEGIQITQWKLRLHNTEDIKLHVWDFSGQEITHSTHQFFLTERSLYLLVLNGRQGHEDADAEYWLELIQSFGGDSPVIVVLNKVKEHPFDVNRSALKQKFPAIREFIATDCEAEIGLKDLQKAIDRETDRLEHLRDAFPTSWVAIKNRLSSMTDNYIPFEEYRRICQEDGEPDSSAQNSLAVHLHSLGIALNYKNDPRLRDTHVLNPHWVTNGIYKLLNAHDITDNKGELALASLENILDCQNYPPARHGFLLELMRKFELCFPFQEDEHRYLIPDLLDKQQPPEAEDFNLEDCLNFRYEYPILPEGLLPRFIVRTHVLSMSRLRWRTGAILEFEGNRALVKADRQDRCVTISVDGAMTSRRRLLAVIRSDFERIHSSFKFIPQAKVPVPSHPEVVLAYQDLVVREEANSNDFTEVVNGKIIKLNARKLLGEIDLDGTRRKRPETGIRTQALRLFYSYSHKDEVLRDTLEIRLKLLQRQGLIQPWHDRRIPAGTDWQDELDRNLEQADIILLLVSPDFLASDYCYKIEMTRALERYEAGEAIVIPILIRSGVDWNAVSFNHIQALPTDLKPVPKWSDPDDAWLNIEQGIKQAIQEKMKRSRTLLKFEDFDGIKVINQDSF